MSKVETKIMKVTFFKRFCYDMNGDDNHSAFHINAYMDKVMLKNISVTCTENKS